MKKQKRRSYLWAYVFILPSVFLILCLNIWPIIETIMFSFQKIEGFLPAEWNGGQNFATLFLKKEEFTKALLNTAIYAVVTVPIGTFLSLVTAVFLNKQIRFKSFFRVCFFIPVISAPAAVAMVWRWIYNSDFGILNYVLSLFGIEGPNWIGSSQVVLLSVMIVGIWSMVGYNMVILLAGLQDIPTVYYEAARIDGASERQCFWRITLPLVSPTTFFVVLTTTISALQVFDNIYMMVPSNSPSLKSAQSIVYLYYKYTFSQQNKGLGSAVAVVLLVIVLALTAIQMRAQKKWVIYQ